MILLTFEEAMNLNVRDNTANHSNHINPELVKILKLVGYDKVFAIARGSTVWDSDGNKYLDFLGGFGSLNLGHNHPEIRKALRMVEKYPNFLQASMNPLAGALAHNLAEVTPGDLQISFFCNSGSEAVEGALKLARAATKRSDIVSFCGAFHGKTLGALSVTGKPQYQEPYEPLVPGISFVDYGDMVHLEEKLEKRDTAALIIEPIQGENGIILPPEGYLSKIRDLCSRTGTLMIVDEIQTGLGRTGKLFACEHDGISPDIMCLSKSLGGGVMPIGAFITTEEIWHNAYGSTGKATLHSSTFGGNTRAVAAGLKALEILVEGDFISQTAEKGDYLLAALMKLKEKHPIMKDVRGKGLLIGIELAAKEHRILDRMTKDLIKKTSREYMGSLICSELFNKYQIITAYTLNNPNVIRLEPPLTISYKQIDYFIYAMDKVLTVNNGFLRAAASNAMTLLRVRLKGNK